MHTFLAETTFPLPRLPSLSLRLPFPSVSGTPGAAAAALIDYHGDKLVDWACRPGLLIGLVDATGLLPVPGVPDTPFVTNTVDGSTDAGATSHVGYTVARDR